MDRMPALSVAAVPGRRKWTIELAQDIERRGFTGIYTPSVAGDSLAFCQALAMATNEISFGTSIAPIYFRQTEDYAATASFIHEMSGGRFRFGIGVSHAPALAARGISGGKPLSDIRSFVSDYEAAPRTGEKAPIVLATLRKKMILLSEEISSGMVFANGARSHMSASLSVLSDETRSGDFFIGNMIPTCVNEDIEAAKAVNRRTLTSYAMLPNYRNYWKEAGYVEEMIAIEQTIADAQPERVPQLLTDQWLADTTLFGSATQVRDGLEAWFDAGIKTPILVPSSANGNQIVAFEELLAIF